MKELTFRGGIHPLRHEHHGKAFSCDKSITVLPLPDVVEVPMAQHIGAPCAPIVEKGERVLVGQKIGEPRGFIGAPVHATVSGVVKDIVARGVAGGNFVQVVRIESDGQDEWIPCQSAKLEELSPEQIVQRIKDAGIVGMGGAGFPTHVKLTPPKDKPIDTVLINAAECEPFLTCDHRVMLEQTEKLIAGVQCIVKAVGAKRAVIGIETNKPDAIAAVEKAAAGNGVEVAYLKPKYPQGGEKQLIYAITRRQVPSGGLPADVGCVVCNVGSTVAIAEAVLEGKPLVQRVVCVTGPSVNQPGNLLARLGTPVSSLLDACGGLKEDVVKVLNGGPMMGTALFDLTVPVVKNMSGITALDQKNVGAEGKGVCIHCGRCAAGCPMHLMPMLIANYSDVNDFASAEKQHALDCIECGSCAYNCPASRTVLASIKVAKQQILAERRRRG